MLNKLLTLIDYSIYIYVYWILDNEINYDKIHLYFSLN